MFQSDLYKLDTLRIGLNQFDSSILLQICNVLVILYHALDFTAVKLHGYLRRVNGRSGSSKSPSKPFPSHPTLDLICFSIFHTSSHAIREVIIPKPYTSTSRTKAIFSRRFKNHYNAYHNNRYRHICHRNFRTRDTSILILSIDRECINENYQQRVWLK